MFKRCAVLFFAFCILFVFCACEVQQTPVSPDASHGESTKQDVYGKLDELETVDFGGRTFRIAVYQTDNIFPENTDTPLGLALSKRNARVEEKYNITLKNVSIPREEFASTLQSAYENGEDICDIVIAPRSMASTFIATDMLMNVNSLPYVNFNKSYFNQAAMNAASLGSFTYEISGDLVSAPGSHWAVCYNIELLNSEESYTDFVTLARNGQWTWENFYKYVNDFRRDLNDDRVMSDEDLFGYTTSAGDETLLKVLWASAGIPFFENEPPKAPKIDFDNEKVEKIIELADQIIQTPGRYTEGGEALSALDLFLNGQSLFYICPASTISYLQFQGMNVGMVPLPKLDEEQTAFCSYVDSNAQAVYVLNNCADTEFVGRIVQALFAASDGLILDNASTVYTSYLTGNAALNFFIEMIEHGYYDPAFSLGDAFAEVRGASWGIIYDCVLQNGNFDKMYQNQLFAFNETFAETLIHAEEKEAEKPE